jgi:hypothetical protein
MSQSEISKQVRREFNGETTEKVMRLGKSLKIIIGYKVQAQLDARVALGADLNDADDYSIDDMVRSSAFDYRKKFSVKLAKRYTENLLTHLIESYNNPKTDPRKTNLLSIADRLGNNWITYNYEEANAIGLEHSWN